MSTKYILKKQKRLLNHHLLKNKLNFKKTEIFEKTEKLNVKKFFNSVTLKIFSIPKIIHTKNQMVL